ncbi:hypothetical protein AB3S75_019986 [Citrus x aurantiifolia]
MLSTDISWLLKVCVSDDAFRKIIGQDDAWTYSKMKLCGQMKSFLKLILLLAVLKAFLTLLKQLSVAFSIV